VSAPRADTASTAALRRQAVRVRLRLTDEDLAALLPLVQKYEADRDALERFLASAPDPVRAPIPPR